MKGEIAQPVFAAKWHFLLADVLFGVHEVTGELLLVNDAAGPRTERSGNIDDPHRRVRAG